MTRNSIHRLMLTATALGGVLVTTACQQATPVARMQSAIEAASTDTAPVFVQQAREALARQDGAAAVSFAEMAVRAEPANADARSVLALAYLSNGRFRSASDAYSDLIEMGADEQARLRRVLALLGAGEHASAMSELYTLNDPRLTSDVGLAYALAGETQRGLDMLAQAARAENATPRARQNLALGYALAGQWAQARAVAAQDLDAATVEKRVQEWAAFAANSDVAWKTARLLSVTPTANDVGRPTELAYVRPAPTEAQPMEQASLETPVEAQTPAPQAEVAPVPAPAQAYAEAANPGVVAPVALPAAVASVATPAVAKRLPTPSATGKWVVQLGAYASDHLLKANWRQATRRNGELLADKRPIRTEVHLGRARLVRLAVGKFETRGDAVELCAALRNRGADCFVRADAAARVAGAPMRVAPKRA